nr:methyl-accepting chemotaxis protein [Janthinobacterium sp. PC23-8]
MSTSAAKEIKVLIGASVAQVEAGGKIVGQAGATIAEVVTSIARMTELMGKISVAAGEQDAGISQINAAMSDMDGVTQQNAALVEEAAAAAGSLEQQTVQLMKLVSVFKLPAGSDRTARQIALSQGADNLTAQLISPTIE